MRSNFGWADGSGADDGDSHRARFFKFTLLQDSQVTLSAARQGGVVVNGTTAEGDFNPAFSIYAGTFGRSYHDGSDHPDFMANHPGYPTTSSYDFNKAGTAKGAFRALNDFTMGNESTEVPAADFNADAIFYRGSAADGAGTTDFAGDGLDDGVAQGTFLLAAGVYSVAVGGACYACQDNDPAAGLLLRGFTTSLQVQPVPLPAAAWLLASGRRVWD